jgi:hypothetical protein
VTFASFGDNYLVQVQNNSVNATSIDMPNYDGTGYKINRNPRNGKPYSTTFVFTPNTLGTPRNSNRRDFLSLLSRLDDGAFFGAMDHRLHGNFREIAQNDGRGMSPAQSSDGHGPREIHVPA